MRSYNVGNRRGIEMVNDSLEGKIIAQAHTQPPNKRLWFTE